jgi:mono/diheme cytochrome c family protein
MIRIVGTKSRAARSARPRAKALGFVLAVAWLLGNTSCSNLENPLRAGQGSPAGAPKLSHDQAMGGVKHASNLCQPIENCSACHGANLQGGTHGEPSCTKCHSDRWNRPDCGRTSHSVSLSGVNHAPDYCTPLQNCTECHGSDLHGGPYGQPSCLKCHTQKKWQNCGGTQHNQRKDGVYHALNYCKPLDYCVQCHGSNLRGGPNNEPSCYRCHGEKWKESDCGR